jgi:hypothetical protein
MIMGGASGGATPDMRWMWDVFGRGSCVSPLVEEDDEGLDC